MFVGSVLLLFVGLGMFNFLVDPFGVFGDPIFDWYSYNVTKNPRVAKVVYLERHPDTFDSFIIGSSGASAFPVDMLNEQFDANFFNMFAYGSDMMDIKRMAQYLIENYTVRNLFLGLYIDMAILFDELHCWRSLNMHVRVGGGSRLSFYGRYLLMPPEYSLAKIRSYFQREYLPRPFNVFDMETGAYDKRRRAVEPIGCMESYLLAYPVFANYPTSPLVMWEMENALNSVAAIRDMAEEAGVNLIVVFNPLYSGHFARFCADEVRLLFKSLADVTPFWDFSMSWISFEPRFFYDATHFRGDIGAMALGRMFDWDNMFIPNDFGVFVTPENVAEHVESLFLIEPKEPALYTVEVPVLMYHHFLNEVSSDIIVSPESFAIQMRALHDNGFNTITPRQLVDFVDYGIPLPENPVVITFDDGYLSVYEHAFPVMAYYGLQGTVFVIGFSVGTDTYRDTGYATTPKFCFDQARRMAGVVSVQSHSYDMHQWAPFEEGRARENVLIWPDECEHEYAAILRADHLAICQLIYTELGEEVISITFPHGMYDELSQHILTTVGIRVSFTSNPGMNTIIMGLPQSLLALNRFNITDCIGEVELLALLRQ